MSFAVASAGAIGTLTALLETRTGQQLADHRVWRLDTALRPLLRARGLDSPDALVALLLGGRDMAIGDQIVDALVNQETSFFRDAPVFDMVGDAVAQVEAGGRRTRVWSAGCSTGQEPLSLAMQFAEAGHPMPELIASDVAIGALARARQGRFTQFEVQRGLSSRRLLRWFEQRETDWVAARSLLDSIGFRRINLLTDPAPAGRFDVILCRNVLLYFNASVRAQVFEKLARALRPDGLLVLGAGETVIGQSAQLEPCPRFRGCYRPAGAAYSGRAV